MTTLKEKTEAYRALVNASSPDHRPSEWSKLLRNAGIALMVGEPTSVPGEQTLRFAREVLKLADEAIHREMVNAFDLDTGG